MWYSALHRYSALWYSVGTHVEVVRESVLICSKYFISIL